MDLFDIAVAKKLADGGGGGGSSDFSTAQVTINNGGLNNYLFPCVGSDGENEYALPSYSTMGGASETATAILYKGMAVLIDNNNFTLQLSGNIEMMVPNFMYIITGDCTITIS